MWPSNAAFVSREMNDTIDGSFTALTTLEFIGLQFVFFKERERE